MDILNMIWIDWFDIVVYGYIKYDTDILCIYIWDIFAVCIVCAGILLTVVLSMNLPHGFLHSPGHDTPYTLWDGVHHPLDPPGSFGQSCVLLVGLVQVPVSVGSMIPCNVDGYTILYYTILYTYIHTCIHTHTYTYTHTQTYRHTEIQTYRHTEIQTYRHTDIQTYRHTNIQTYIHTYIYTYCIYKLYILCFIMIAYVNTCIIFKDIWYTYIYIFLYIQRYTCMSIFPYIKDGASIVHPIAPILWTSAVESLYLVANHPWLMIYYLALGAQAGSFLLSPWWFAIPSGKLT